LLSAGLLALALLGVSLMASVGVGRQTGLVFGPGAPPIERQTMILPCCFSFRQDC
jgi:hypothetical protein